MSSYLDRARRKTAKHGNNSGESISNSTINFINSEFANASTFRVMDVSSSRGLDKDKKKMDARVVQIDRMGSLREILLRPSESLEIGTYVSFDGDDWLITDKHGGTGTTSVKLTSIRTNNVLKWYDEDSELHEIRCVASATDLGSKSKQSKNEIEWNKHDVRLPVGQLFISVELNDSTEMIGLNHRFIFGKSVYEVTGIDDMTLTEDDYGIIQFTVKLTTKDHRDDFDNGIAYNRFNSEEGGDTPW